MTSDGVTWIIKGEGLVFLPLNLFPRPPEEYYHRCCIAMRAFPRRGIYPRRGTSTGVLVRRDSDPWSHSDYEATLPLLTVDGTHR